MVRDQYFSLVLITPYAFTNQQSLSVRSYGNILGEASGNKIT